MGYQKNTGLDRVVKAFGYSCQGLVAAWRSEAAFRQEVVLCLILIPVGLWFGETGIERAILVMVVMIVPMIELVNSAIEAVVDRVGEEIHPLSGRAKDIGSAAVFLSIVIATVVWILVLM